MTSPYDLSDDTPVYVISVAAQLSGLHPQTLRAYDRLGLVSPGRSAGRGRRYSMRDILALRTVQRLSQEEGVNLSGIKRILELTDELERSRRLAAELHSEAEQLRIELESTRAVAARLAELLRRSRQDPALTPVPVRSGRVTIWEPLASAESRPPGPRAAGQRARESGPGKTRP